jgi:hypothetical protein
MQRQLKEGAKIKEGKMKEKKKNKKGGVGELFVETATICAPER